MPTSHKKPGTAVPGIIYARYTRIRDDSPLVRIYRGTYHRYVTQVSFICFVVLLRMIGGRKTRSGHAELALRVFATPTPHAPRQAKSPFYSEKLGINKSFSNHLATTTTGYILGTLQYTTALSENITNLRILKPIYQIGCISESAILVFCHI